MIQANIANGTIIPTQAQTQPVIAIAQPQPQTQPQYVPPSTLAPTFVLSTNAPPPPPQQQQQKPVEIQIEEVDQKEKNSKQYRGRAQTPGPQSRKRPLLAEEDEEESDDEENDSIIDFSSDNEDVSPSRPQSRPQLGITIKEEKGKAVPATPRKRPSRELDDDAVDQGAESFLRTGSPPKRIRVDGTFSPARVATPPSTSPLRKRSSAELEDGDKEIRSSPLNNGDTKRLKTASAPTGKERLEKIRILSAERAAR